MTSGSNPSGSYLPSKVRCSKIDDNYLKELNEDLKLRKQELLEILKPLEDKNNLLFQKLMSNLEEKQRSLQIMRQIMAGKGSEESSIMELIKEAEEMKQNLERKNKMLRKEMEMLWNKVPKTPSSPRKTKNELETSCAEKVKEKKKKLFLPPGKATEENGMGQVSGTSQHPSGTVNTTTTSRLTTSKNESNVRILGSKTYTEQQRAKGSQFDDVGGRIFFLRSLPDEALKD
ncbi:putative coiled-coil domain-containing protein 196 isoform X4 [Panthera tigris]|uniref:putative coiled-coil domain-containing protein 196 isoform X4 n=1 Tax=Panthera leo TaxID=9689 RepID=UPI001C6A1156|nr:putative coiled-coil domain-containing protein 196 isoform X4 [Panthera leo]XP_042843697.1 putative coiled-coil domain-containing protein 196 isoform X4 [Panthera tigris]XP_060476053.1 putative coiled-coil domain-containing protein 196 isoform X4 [Panthera onca]